MLRGETRSRDAAGWARHAGFGTVAIQGRSKTCRGRAVGAQTTRAQSVGRNYAGAQPLAREASSGAEDGAMIRRHEELGTTRRQMLDVECPLSMPLAMVAVMRQA
jgi:hypothetical protein